MKIIRAKSAGFCWGVERAINIAVDLAAKQGKKVITDGPLIHNEQMMDKLSAQGISEAGDYQSKADLELDGQKDEDAVLVVRAHGISPERRKYLKGLGMPFKDATCPDVGIIAGKIRIHAKKGYAVVIFGDPEHPEVIGLLGYSQDRGHVVQSLEQVDDLPPLGEKVCLVSQSTMFSFEFQQVAEQLRERYPDLLIFDTICGATKDRQDDIRLLVDQGAEAIVVIGGRHSANTKKLAALAQKHALPTYHIETAKEIDTEAMQQYSTVGVTAGASTPNFIIDAVCQKLEDL